MNPVRSNTKSPMHIMSISTITVIGRVMSYATVALGDLLLTG